MEALLYNENVQAMTSDEFIASVLSLKENLKAKTSSIRELKAIYFSINLDYIRLCEVSKQSSYFPSRSCDVSMKKCTCQAHYDSALEILVKRIDQVVESLK